MDSDLHPRGSPPRNDSEVSSLTGVVMSQPSRVVSRPLAAATGMNFAGVPAHLTVTDVLQAANTAITQALPRTLWVKGEMSSYKAWNSGHHYFDLVERREGQRDAAMLNAIIWQNTWH